MTNSCPYPVLKPLHSWKLPLCDWGKPPTAPYHSERELPFLPAFLADLSGHVCPLVFSVYHHTDIYIKVKVIFSLSFEAISRPLLTHSYNLHAFLRFRSSNNTTFSFYCPYCHLVTDLHSFILMIN